MTQTSEQRDRHQLCGARKKNGELCRKFAGEGTEHLGVGKCKYHGGNTPTHRTHAVKELAKRQAVEFGVPLPVEPTDALLSMVHLSAGHLSWLKEELAAIEDKTSFTGQVLMRAYNDERDRCARTAKLALDAGVAERSVKLAERYGHQLATLIRAVFDDPELALTPAQRATLPDLLRRHLTAMADERPALTAA